MIHQGRWLRVAAAGLGVTAAVGVGMACSLDLDPALMADAGLGAEASAQEEAGSGGMGGQGSSGAAAEGGASPIAVDGGVGCTSDADCLASSPGGACVTSARCDTTWHLCMYDVCNAGSCQASGCDLISRACTAPEAYGYEVSLFPVAFGGVGGWGPHDAIAAEYPFLFVLTTNGVVAYDIADPLGTAPPAMIVQGVPFIPAAVVASGRRVYFVGPVAGNGPNYRQAVAWIDVPGDPFLTSLEATTAWIGTTQGALANAIGDGAGGLDLIYAASSQPTGWVRAPLRDTTMLVPSPINGLTPDAGLVAAAGAALVAYRLNPNNRHPAFALVAGAQTSSGQESAEVAIASYGPVDPQATFGGADDVSVLWESAPLRVTADGGTAGVQAARLTWLATAVDGGPDASVFDTQLHADLETYAASTTGSVVGQPAYLGGDATLGLAAVPGNLQNTSIQVFSRATGALVPGERAVLPVGPAAVGVATANGFGYLLAQDDPQNRSATVYIVAPGCGSTATTMTPDAGREGGAAEGGTGSSGGFKSLGTAM